ncbi:universal stress protein [Variovorax sp. N23]|uniref:universal stress protein n=1 Tax=Variovorax sp. N23 TaxID=2980555 RepID=UPI0021C78654|nr:universal stress protein [Variovorax sp. N23]MCU4119931.1 universal stress protein [Variovorax sp. N23]
MYSRILVPLDGSKTAQRGLDEAIRLAAALKSKLHLLHVIDDFPMLMEMSVVSNFETTLNELRAYAKKMLADAVTRASEAGVPSDISLREVVQERIAGVIVDEAGKAGCDLIVMGTHGRRGIGRVALGSDAENVLRTSPVPVLLVRSAS